mmetsp:Transcript_51797/g.136962  ORF Transcript_51797/g.136962 Transcript_51797/m.136962 type:complete len:180 (-) Transcript_51797:178-717(-)
MLYATRKVSLEQFLQALWPKANAEDISQMIRWARQEETKQLLINRHRLPEAASWSNDDMREMFDALDADGGGSISIQELVEAGVLDTEEAKKTSKTFDIDGSGVLEFNEFVTIFKPSIAAMLMEQRQKQDERDSRRGEQSMSFKTDKNAVASELQGMWLQHAVKMNMAVTPGSQKDAKH